jgi:hypothetical protein
MIFFESLISSRSTILNTSSNEKARTSMNSVGSDGRWMGRSFFSQVDVRGLVDHALRRVIGAELHEPVRLVPCFLRQLALNGRLCGFAGLRSSGGHFPVEGAGDVAALADHHDRVRVEEREHVDAAGALDHAVDRRLAVGERHLILAHANAAILVDLSGGGPPPGYARQPPTIRHDAMTSRRRAAAGL